MHVPFGNLGDSGHRFVGPYALMTLAGALLCFRIASLAVVLNTRRNILMTQSFPPTLTAFLARASVSVAPAPAACNNFDLQKLLKLSRPCKSRHKQP